MNAGTIIMNIDERFVKMDMGINAYLKCNETEQPERERERDAERKTDSNTDRKREGERKREREREEGEIYCSKLLDNDPKYW